MSTRLLVLLVRTLTGMRAGKRQVARAARSIRRTAAYRTRFKERSGPNTALDRAHYNRI